MLALPPGDELRPPRPLRVAAVNGRCFTHWDELAAPGEVPVLLLHCRPGAAVPEEAAAQLVARAAALLADCVPAALAERPLQTVRRCAAQPVRAHSCPARRCARRAARVLDACRAAAHQRRARRRARARFVLLR
ncbi:MAG: hypothetical protein ACK4L4_20355, partial [Gemmobacter sp.]